MTGIGNHHIWPFDEAFVAEVAREMHVSGDFVVPRLGGLPFLEKPPLHYTAVAAAYRVFGVTPFAARLPSALAGLLTLGLTYFIGRRLFDRRVGLCAAWMLTTMFLFFHATHSCLIDPTLVLFVTGAFLCAAPGRRGGTGPGAVLMLYLATALAFLTKGFVGPGLIVLGLGANAVRERSWPRGRLRAHVAGAALLLALMGAWAAALHARGGTPFVREAYLANSLGRMFAIPSLHPAHDAVDVHTLPFWSLPLGVLGNVMPWTPLLLLALVPARFRRGGAPPASPEARDDAAGDGRPEGARAWLATIVLVDLAALSVMNQQRGMFVLPLYPLIACLIALEVSRLRARGAAASPLVRGLVGLQVGIVCLLALLSAAALVVVPAWADDGTISGGPVAAAAILVIFVLVATWCAAVLWRAARFAPALGLVLSLVVVSLASLAAILPPRIDAKVSFASFFMRARALTEKHAATPVLGTGNEAYVGLADLALEKELPLAIRKPELMRACASDPDLYFITKDLSLIDFGPDLPVSSRILLSASSTRRNPLHPEVLYFVELRHAEAPPAPAVTTRR